MVVGGGGGGVASFVRHQWWPLRMRGGTESASQEPASALVHSLYSGSGQAVCVGLAGFVPYHDVTVRFQCCEYRLLLIDCLCTTAREVATVFMIVSFAFIFYIIGFVD
ncbi:hypothetical protein J6590_053141 [Homalodisca vitripennis]|nr:hypothetical protein J6590_053141 [Homalodisca vitripennis]